MDNIFGKYRVVIPKTTESLNPAYHARVGTSFEWDYVVKVYATRPLHSREDEEAFRQHIAILRQLEHPHILPITDYGFEKNIPFYVTTYLTKGSLREYLEQASPLSLSIQEMVTIIVQIGQALQHAHDQHIIHGNIKPENILFDTNNAAQLLDFHLPEKVGARGNIATSTVQFSYYPERETLNKKSDQYALGSLANELFSTLLPSYIQTSISSLQPDTTGEVLTPAFSHSTNEVVKQIKAKIMKAMASNPKERYKDIATFIEALNRVGTAQFVITTSQPVTLVPVGYSFHNTKTMPIHTLLPRRKPFTLISGDPMHNLLFIVTIALLLGLLLSGSLWLLTSGKPGQQTVVSLTSTAHILDRKGNNRTPQTINTAAAVPTATPQTNTAAAVPTSIVVALPIPSSPTPVPIPIPTAPPAPRPTPNPLSASVAGFWNFDQGRGSIASDASGNGHTGFLQGNARWGPPHAGSSAISLDGSNGTNVDISNPVVNTAQSFSVTAWVNVSSFNNNLYQTFVSIDGNVASAFDLQWRPDTHKFAFTRLYDDGMTYTGSSIASASSFPATNTWYNLAGVYDASAQTIALYVNGSLQQTVPDTNSWQGSGHTEIGRALYTGKRVDFVVGEIDNVNIYKGALTADNVASLAAAG